jgi:hypothetical protein
MLHTWLDKPQDLGSRPAAAGISGAGIATQHAPDFLRLLGGREEPGCKIARFPHKLSWTSLPHCSAGTSFHSTTAIAVHIAICAMIPLVATALMKRRQGHFRGISIAAI